MASGPAVQLPPPRPAAGERTGAAAPRDHLGHQVAGPGGEGRTADEQPDDDLGEVGSGRKAGVRPLITELNSPDDTTG